MLSTMFVPAFRIKQCKTETNNNLKPMVAKCLGFSKSTRRGSLLAASRGRLVSGEAGSTNETCLFEGKGCSFLPGSPSSCPLSVLQFVRSHRKGEGKPAEAPDRRASRPPTSKNVPVLRPSMHPSLPERGWPSSLKEGGRGSWLVGW